MFRKKLPMVVYLLIALAVTGIAIKLFNNPVGFLKSALITIAIGAAIFGFVYFVLFKNGTAQASNQSSEMKKYKQALKQSKAKYSTNLPVKSKSRTKPTSTKGQVKRKFSKRPTHLKVIEGNKKEEKNRATF